MSPRRVRFEAKMFRDDSVAFEACAGFRAGPDAPGGREVCHCGWGKEDHHYRARVPAPSALRRRNPVGLPIAAFGRRAS